MPQPPRPGPALLNRAERDPGALNSVAGGYRTMRYQELVVTALTACRMAGTTAPLGLLDHLAAFALAAFPGHAVAPRPQFVLMALERELARRSVTHPQERARQILPGIDSAFT